MKYSQNTPNSSDEKVNKKLSFVSENTLCNIDQLRQTPNNDVLLTEDNIGSIFALSKSNISESSMFKEKEKNSLVDNILSRISDFETKKQFFEEKVKSTKNKDTQERLFIPNKIIPAGKANNIEDELIKKDKEISAIKEELYKLKADYFKLQSQRSNQKSKIKKLSINRYGEVDLCKKQNKSNKTKVIKRILLRRYLINLSVEVTNSFSIMSNRSKTQLIDLANLSKTASKSRRNSFNFDTQLIQIKEESNSKSNISLNKDDKNELTTPNKIKIPIFVNKNMTELKKKINLSNYTNIKNKTVQKKESISTSSKETLLNPSITDLHCYNKIKSILNYPPSAKKETNNKIKQNKPNDSLFNDDSYIKLQKTQHKRLNSTFIYHSDYKLETLNNSKLSTIEIGDVNALFKQSRFK